MLVLIADHHAIVRTGLAYFVEQLSEDIEVVQAQSFEHAVNLLGQRKADLAVVGAFQSNGAVAPQVSELADAASPSPLVVFADPGSREMVEECMRAGAKAFVPKSTDERQLVHILRLVMEGGSYVLPDLLLDQSKGQQIWQAPEKVAGSTGHLTSRQLDVLNCLRLGMSNNDIADELGLNLSTVKGHVSAVLKTLGVRNRTQAVITTRRSAE